MNTTIAALISELCTLVAELGQDGGLVSPSIYDTAQVLRFYPCPESVEPATDWLLAQQQADGGWGDPAAPYARAVPTLSTLLALQHHGDRVPDKVYAAGFAYLQDQAPLWQELVIDALPIATEMILPCLLDEAITRGLPITRTPYHFLYQLRRQKCQQISKHPLRAGTPPVYSWEALGQEAQPDLIDESGGIGHSPSATAAWLHQAIKQPALADLCHSAITYLQRAAAVTGVNVPGVVPNVWPITGFEMSYGPYALLVTKLLSHPHLHEALGTQLRCLEHILVRGQGISFGEYFMPDVDETAVGLAVLYSAGYPVDTQVLQQFKYGDHFHTFPHELNPSVLSNAHALYALAGIKQHSEGVAQFLRKRQGADGRWLPDKWHSSWLYTTLETVLAFEQLGSLAEVNHAIDLLLTTQKQDGGWGSGMCATQVETSYALIGLNAVHQRNLSNDAITDAIQRGHQWLQHQYKRQSPTREHLWLGKELYSPYRVDRIYVVSALLSVLLQKEEV
jgi:Squalene-hopene cyclase C-terminal domain/Prenyltransferase and squalene oxidase repeat